MSLVKLTDHNAEIDKYEQILGVAINKLKTLKTDYLTSQTELKTAEAYIETLRKQIAELHQQPKVAITTIPNRYEAQLQHLKIALELNETDTEKIKDDYIKRKGYA